MILGASSSLVETKRIVLSGTARPAFARRANPEPQMEIFHLRFGMYWHPAQL